LVFPGTGTGVESKRKIQVSISFTSDRVDEGMFKISGTGAVKRLQTQSLLTTRIIRIDYMEGFERRRWQFIETKT